MTAPILADSVGLGVPAPLMLRNATVLDAAETRTADVLLAQGKIAAIGAHAVDHSAATGACAHDLTGYLLLPSGVECHTHLDKAMLARRFPNPTGDIPGALDAIHRAYASMSEEDVRQRAVEAALTAVSHGYTAIRTHVNCEGGIGTTSVRVLCELRRELAGLVEIQVAAMAVSQITGSGGAKQRACLEEAIEIGIDLVGGAPEVDSQPIEAMRYLVGLAAETGLSLDLHMDETTDRDVFTLGEMAKEVSEHALGGRASASHCVSLGQQDETTVRRTAEDLATAGVAVVTLPQTNLWLQGRTEEVRVPRGLAPIAALRRAGVTVAAGGDNWRDPFNPLGRIDPFETCELLVAAAHLTPDDAYRMATAASREAMGLEPVSIEIGNSAELLAVRASDIDDAVASANADRWVFRGGRLVARTRIVHDLDPISWLDPGTMVGVEASAARVQ